METISPGQGRFGSKKKKKNKHLTEFHSENQDEKTGMPSKIICGFSGVRL